MDDDAVCESAALDVPLLHGGDPADAGPAFLLHLHEVFHAVEVGGDVGSLLVGGLLADGVGLVDVVDAAHLEVVGALGGGGGGEDGQQGEDEHQEFHLDD